MMDTAILAPCPKKLEWGVGTFVCTAGDCMVLPSGDKDGLLFTARRLQQAAEDRLTLKIPLMVDNAGDRRPAFAFERDAALAEEAYALTIDNDGVRIRYATGAAAFHAVSTLKQLMLQCGRKLPFLTIEDEPDFRARGILYDISRSRIPTMESLFALVDFMADLKLNQLQLYIEGFSYAYPSYPQVWQDGTPMTGEEFMALDQYCRARYMELVPVQNSLGHMMDWLAREEFRDLAECPDGYEAEWKRNGLERPGTLDPTDPKAFGLVRNMAADLLPYFSSGLYNVCLDEPYELGKGKNQALREQIGRGRLYLNYVLKMHELVNSRGKRMMFWGDVIREYPELIGELPRDIVALEWGYEADAPFDANGAKYKEAGIDFYVCPGTSSWNAICGKTDKMAANLRNAAINGKKHGAVGYLNTDWGDGGHWQPIVFSYPGFVYGAGLSWSVDANLDMDIAACLDRFVVRDRNRVAGSVIMGLGRYGTVNEGYWEQEYGGNMTEIARLLQYTSADDTRGMERLAGYSFDKVRHYLLDMLARLDEARMECPDAALVEAEVRNAAALAIHGCDLGTMKRCLQEGRRGRELRELLERMVRDMTVIIRRHESLWLQRDRHGGLQSSAGRMRRLKEQYESLLRAGVMS